MPKSCKKKKRPRGAYSTLHTHSTQTHTHTREKSIFIVVFSTLLLTIFLKKEKNRRIAEPAGSGEPNRSLSHFSTRVRGSLWLAGHTVVVGSSTWVGVVLCVSRAARNLTSHKTFEPFLPLQRILFDCYFGCGYNHRHHHHESSASEREREWKIVRVKGLSSYPTVKASPLHLSWFLPFLCVCLCVRCELGERDYYVGSLRRV
jgi:hypothetical protein